MADSQYSYFYGIVHPPGKKDASEVVNIADDMTHEQVKDLDLVDYAITEGHPPNGESITKHANLVRGRVVHQYMDQQGNKVIMGKLMHNGMSGIRTRYRIESGSNASLSLGHTVRPVEDENNNLNLKFLGDHIAIVDEPRRPGCHIHGMVRADRIDREKVTSRMAQLMNKVPTDRLAQQQQSAHSASVAMDAQLQGVAANQAAAPATNASNLPIPGAVPMQQQQQQQQQQSEPDLSRDQLLVAAINAAEEAKATRAELERLKAERAEEQRQIQEREAARRQQEREKKEKATRETESIMVEYIKQAAANGDAAAKAAVERYEAMPGGVAKALYDSDETKREEGLDMWNNMVMCAGQSFTNQTMAQNQRVQELMHKRARESDVHQYANKRPMISEWSTASSSSSSSAAAVAPPSSSMMGASSSSTSSAPVTRNLQQERQDLMMDITRYAHSAGYVQAAIKSGGGGMNRLYEKAYGHAIPKAKPAFIRK